MLPSVQIFKIQYKQTRYKKKIIDVKILNLKFHIIQLTIERYLFTDIHTRCILLVTRYLM